VLLVATAMWAASCAAPDPASGPAPGDDGSLARNEDRIEAPIGAWRVVPAGIDGERCSTRIARPGVDEGRVGASERCIGPVLGTQPFVALLPSWNLTVDDGLHAVVEVRVRAAADGRWSPWLFVGEWGSGAIPAQESATTAFAWGRVATDWVLLDEPADAAQLRVAAFGRSAEGDGAGVRIEQLAVCFEHADAAPRRAPFPAPRTVALPVEVGVPFFSQRQQRPEIAGRICSPTSVAMVLAASMAPREVEAVAARAFDPRNDIYGNWPRNVQAAWSFGLPGFVTRFDDWDAVARHFAAGRPVVASIGVQPGQLTGAPYASTRGHLIVLRGFDANGDVLVNDPAGATEAEGRVTYRRDELDMVWLERGGTAYVFDSVPR